MIFIVLVLMIVVLGAILIAAANRTPKTPAMYNVTYTSGPPPDVTQRIRYMNNTPETVYPTVVVESPVYDPYATFAATMLAQELIERPIIVEQPIVVEETSYYNSDTSSDATGYVGYQSDFSSNSDFGSSSDSGSGDFGGGGSGGDW